MNSIYVTIVLRLVHILSAIFWLGGVLVVARFLLPTARELGPAAAPVLTHLMQNKKLPVALLGSGWLAVLSGSTLYMRAGAALGDAWYGSSQGRVLGIGGTLGVITVLIGTFGNVPAARRMGRVMAQLHANPGNADLVAEQQRIQIRLSRLTQLAAVLLLLAASCMAVARYWP